MNTVHAAQICRVVQISNNKNFTKVSLPNKNLTFKFLLPHAADLKIC